MNVHSYLSIPFTTLQFVKSDSGFFAAFQATVTIKNKDSKEQLNRRTWKDSIFVDDYIETTDRLMHRVLYASTVLPTGKYILTGEIIDLETQYNGNTKTEIQTEKYSKSPVIYPGVIVADKQGNGLNIFETWQPELTNVLLYEETGLNLYLCGRIDPGGYLIQLDISTLENENIWTNKYSYSGDGSSFEHVITIPDSVFTGFKVNLKTVLTQHGKESAETIIIPLMKPGISSQITNVTMALDQMKYILTKDEGTRVKKAKKSEREALFLSLWKTRDPSPNTVTNELMNEYYRRVEFANEHFSEFQPGWTSDQGMIYILFGKPDTIDRSTSYDRRTVYELWNYYSINKQFIFKDSNGFGDYRLDTPYFLTPQ